MKHQTCNYGENCKYFHPRKLKPINQTNSMNSQPNQKENLTYAQIVKTAFRPEIQTNEKNSFLGQSQCLQQPVIGLRNQCQQPFTGQDTNTQVFLDLQNGQKQMMQMFMNLNQKLMNMEKQNLQNLQMQPI